VQPMTSHANLSPAPELEDRLASTFSTAKVYSSGGGQRRANASG
jgi:hypothetical protein